ncbi:MAG TPA: GntR family transcriptional regulator [Solirubrobacter sp.]
MAMLQVDSVVDLAYERIRELVLAGDIAPGARLGQVELAERLGISRTPVREALRRLSAEGLVDSHPNRGFWVAELSLDAVLRRLEVRLLLEPGIARLAAERRTERHLAELERTITREEKARNGTAAHDASRAFHFVLARATGNEEHVRILDSLWLVEVGRRLLSRRATEVAWQGADVSEHRAIAQAVGDRRGDDAARLMEAHVRAAVRHWEAKR